MVAGFAAAIAEGVAAEVAAGAAEDAATVAAEVAGVPSRVATWRARRVAANLRRWEGAGRRRYGGWFGRGWGGLGWGLEVRWVGLGEEEAVEVVEVVEGQGEFSTTKVVLMPPLVEAEVRVTWAPLAL